MGQSTWGKTVAKATTATFTGGIDYDNDKNSNIIFGRRRGRSRRFLPLAAGIDDNDNDNNTDDDEINATENPYADPNYPDLEFINYDDPNYVVDQGLDESFAPTDDTEEKIEEMREERRRKNDEYQFETYSKNMLLIEESSTSSSRPYLGEWTVYRTDTFLDGNDGNEDEDNVPSSPPKILKGNNVLHVVSTGERSKEQVDGGDEGDNGDRLLHHERIATADDPNPPPLQSFSGGTFNGTPTDFELNAFGERYTPELMRHFDFRGSAGIMCVGNAYTVCNAVPLSEKEEGGALFDGPFSELKVEVGIKSGDDRFRVKMDYRSTSKTIKDGGVDNSAPILHLYSLIVCRESSSGEWPCAGDGDGSLFGPPIGAPGGLYDPPPVGGDKQAEAYYVSIDLEGESTVLLPHTIDQIGEDGAGGTVLGWVWSLDWTPGKMRYQADRKVKGGVGLRGLRTLELSEVQGNDADRWRPSGGAEDMRQ